MRKKQKHFSQSLFGLLGLFLIGIAFGGCEAERDFTSNTEKIILRKISFDEFKSKNIIFDKFKQSTSVREPSSELQRVIYDDKYDVWYDTDNIISIEKEGYISYTIPLIKQPNDSLIKNLVIYEKDNEPIKVKMMQYALTDEDINRIHNGEYVDIQSKTTSKSYVTNSSWSTSWYDDSGCLVTATVTYIPGTLCQGIQHHSYGEPCEHAGTSLGATPSRLVVKYTYAFCPPDSTTSGGTNPPPSDPGGGGPGGDGSNPDDGATTPINNETEEEIITTPVVPGLTSDVEQIDDPCAKLKVLLTNDGLNLSAEIDYLKGKINDPSNKNEHAVSVTKRINAGTGSPEYRPGTRIELGPNGGRLPTGGYVIGGVHCHTPKGYSMFSFEDVNALKKLYDSITTPQRKKEVFFMMVAKNKQSGAIETYSILVEDIEKLGTEINNKLNSPKLDYIDLLPLSSEEKKAEKLKTLTRIEGFSYENNNYSQEDLELGFLQRFTNFGISIYKATPDLSNWIKLEQPENATDTQPKKTPCN